MNNCKFVSMKHHSVRYLLAALVALFITLPAVAKDKEKINWMSWGEVEAAMKKEPKQVWVYVYRKSCGWCKLMRRKTFSDPNVIKYMNEHFYAVKFDAETEEDIQFMGETYVFETPPDKHRGVSQLATKLLKSDYRYPSLVHMDERFEGPEVIVGFKSVQKLQAILTYYQKQLHKQNISFEEFAKAFTPTWE